MLPNRNSVPSLYASLECQQENLGDLVIRRNAIQALADSDSRRVILAANISPGFISAANAGVDARIISNNWSFVHRLFKDSLTSRVTFLLAPGPVTLESSTRRHLKSLVVLLVSIHVRLTGGRVVSIGRSLRGDSFLGKWLERFQLRASTHYFVRDFESSKVLGARLNVMPDMALWNKPNLGPEARKYVAISLRSIQPESRRLLGDLVRRSIILGLQPILVTQVKFDNDIHEELSREFGVLHSAWNEQSHQERLSEVLHIYSQSYLIVSNRLHGLLLGAGEGALPVGVDIGKNEKISNTFEGILAFDTLENVTEFNIDEGYMLRKQIMHESLVRAYHRLHALNFE